jgi:hypothetical protein
MTTDMRLLKDGSDIGLLAEAKAAPKGFTNSPSGRSLEGRAAA